MGPTIQLVGPTGLADHWRSVEKDPMDSLHPPQFRPEKIFPLMSFHARRAVHMFPLPIVHAPLLPTLTLGFPLAGLPPTSLVPSVLHQLAAQFHSIMAQPLHSKYARLNVLTTVAYVRLPVLLK